MADLTWQERTYIETVTELIVELTFAGEHAEADRLTAQLFNDFNKEQKL